MSKTIFRGHPSYERNRNGKVNDRSKKCVCVCPPCVAEYWSNTVVNQNSCHVLTSTKYKSKKSKQSVISRTAFVSLDWVTNFILGRLYFAMKGLNLGNKALWNGYHSIHNLILKLSPVVLVCFVECCKLKQQVWTNTRTNNTAKGIAPLFRAYI